MNLHDEIRKLLSPSDRNELNPFDYRFGHSAILAVHRLISRAYGYLKFCIVCGGTGEARPPGSFWAHRGGTLDL